MKFQFKKAETSVILLVFIKDSRLTTGAGLGSLIHTSSIVGGYVKRGGTGVALAVDEDVTTEGTYQAPSAAGKVRIGTPANMPTGFYELHFHNDLFTTADYVTIGLGGAANMAPLNLEIQLTDIDLNTALASSTIGTCTTNTDMVGTDGANTVVPDAAGVAAGLWTTAMVESYAAQGATMTPAQAFHMLWSLLKSTRNVNTTTPSSLGLDDTTTKMTFLTNSATVPTEMKRT